MFPIWHSIGLWSSSASRYSIGLCCWTGSIIDLFYRFTDCWLVLCLSEVLPCSSSWISWFCIFYVWICYRFLSSLQYMSALEKDPLPCTKGMLMLQFTLLTVVGSAGDKADFVYCLIWGWALSIVWFLLSSVNRCSLRQWSWSDPSLPPTSCTTSSTCGARSSLMFRFLILVWFIPSSDAVGVPVTGFYVPFVMIVVNMLMGQNFISVLIGIIIGHIFYFFTQVYLSFSLVMDRFSAKLLVLPFSLLPTGCIQSLSPSTVSRRKALMMKPLAPPRPEEYSNHFRGSSHVLGSQFE